MNSFDGRAKFDASTAIVKMVFLCVMCMLAGLTVFTHIAQAVGITFKSYAYASLLVIAFISVLLWPIIQGQIRLINGKDNGALLVLAVISVAGALISVIFNLAKVNPDMFYYVPNAVYHLQNPDFPMDFGVHSIANGSHPFFSYFSGVSYPFEYIQAIVAYFFKTEFLFVYSIVTPFFLGALIPLGIYYLTVQFIENPMHAAVGSLFAVAVILLLGETGRSPGSLSFIGIHLGKVFVLSTGIPLFAAASVDFFRRVSRAEWILLAATTTAMVGTSSTSIFALLSLAIVLAIAFLAANAERVGTESKRMASVLAIYFSVLFYLVLYAIFMKLNLPGNLGKDNPINSGFPVTFWGHAAMLFEKSGPATPLALIGSTALSFLLLSPGKERRFLAAWIVALIVLFLNPIVAPFLIDHFTTPNTYWRMFYLYPLALLLGITGAKLFEHTNRLSKTTRFAIVCAAGLVLVAAHFPRFTTSALKLRTEISWPRYKAPSALVSLARGVIAAAPPGSMLAPPILSGVIPMLSANYPQIWIFEDQQRFFESGLLAEADMRNCASFFLGGNNYPYKNGQECESGNPLAQFQAVVEKNLPDSIVGVKDVVLKPDVLRILNQNGFTLHKEVGDVVVLSRQ